MAFLAVYASRVGANGIQIGLLTAGPAVVNLLFSLPAGRWLEKRRLVRISFVSSIWHRLPYLLLIPLPVLDLADFQIKAIILIVLIMSVPGTILAIAFNAMFADVVPPDKRAEVVGKRNALLAVSLTVTSIICGAILDRVPFPCNYQIVFAIGAVGAMLSSYHLGKITQLPLPKVPRVGKPLYDIARPGLMRFVDTIRIPVGLRFLTRSTGKPLLRLDLLRSSFGSFLVAFFLFYTFQYVPVPLFPLLFVRVLHLSDGQISLGYALYYLVMLIVSLGLGRMGPRYGYRRILVVSAVFYAQFPLLIGLATNATYFWVASLIGGGVWALANGGLVNRLMERVPEDDRPAHMALHNLMLNLGILAGSLIGPLLGDFLGLRNAALVSAALRFLGGLLLGVWG